MNSHYYNFNTKKQIKASRSDILYIGKLKVLKTPDFGFIIPVFSFLIAKEPSGEYVSACIYLKTRRSRRRTDWSRRLSRCGSS
jgi:hypothetical protein